jgi:hypothetical protein
MELIDLEDGYLISLAIVYEDKWILFSLIRSINGKQE